MVVGRGHHQLYQSLLPSYTDTSAPEVVDRLVRAVDEFLWDQMAQGEDVDQSPPQRILHDFGESDKDYESLFDYGTPGTREAVRDGFIGGFFILYFLL